MYNWWKKLTEQQRKDNLTLSLICLFGFIFLYLLTNWVFFGFLMLPFLVLAPVFGMMQDKLKKEEALSKSKSVEQNDEQCQKQSDCADVPCSIDVASKNFFSKKEYVVERTPELYDKPVYGSSFREIIFDYCVIDVETTDLNPKRGEIIEITALRVRHNQIQDRFTTLVKPVGEIPSYTKHLTGITNEMVALSPTIEEVLPKFFDFVGDDIVIGHNITFDLRFISWWSYLTLKKDFLNRYVDTLSLSRKVFPECENHTLETLTEFLSLPRSAHRSEADCIATKALYDAIKATALERNIDCFYADQVASVNPSDILPTISVFDENHPLFGKNCVIVGKLPISRVNAMQYIADRGGINTASITRKTNILIVGDPNSSMRSPDGKSSQQRKAEELIQNGQELSIIDKKEFIRLLDL